MTCNTIYLRDFVTHTYRVTVTFPSAYKQTVCSRRLKTWAKHIQNTQYNALLKVIIRLITNWIIQRNRFAFEKTHRERDNTLAVCLFLLLFTHLSVAAVSRAIHTTLCILNKVFWTRKATCQTYNKPCKTYYYNCTLNEQNTRKGNMTHLDHRPWQQH